MKLGIVASSMQYKGITLLLAIVLMLAGIVSLVFIPKDEFPRFELPVGMVVGVYPGASEEEVELQLANPMEDFLWSFKEIDKTKTMTVCENGLCYSIVFMNQSVKNKTEFWNKLKERLPMLRAQLPAGVLGVVANDDFGDVSAMLVTIESDTKTYRELEDYEKQLCDRLRTISSLANIYKMGMQKEQIGIYIDRDQLPSYGLNTLQLHQKLSAQSGTMYMGSLDDGQLSRGFHIRSTVNTEHDLANLIVHNNPAGGVVRLGDVADIKREYPSPKRFIKNNGKKCLLLSLQMTEGHNIIDFSNKVKKEIEACKKELPKDVAINVISDQGAVVSQSVDDFLIEMLIAIFSVILVVMFILPVRVAGVAVVTIPITIFASLTVFYFCGIEINTVSLAALIVSLGMIVDDSVVVVDCYLDKLDEGMTRWQAAIQAAQQFTGSIFTATLAISIIFFPLLFTTDNIIHDFIMWFPFSITVVLVVSMLVALLVVPILQYQFIRKGLKDVSVGFLGRIQTFYDRMIERCFRHRYTTLAIGMACIVAGGLLILLVPQRIMPRATRSQFAVEVILPTGTDIRRTEHIADSMANILMRDKRVSNLTVFYGSGSPRFHAVFVPQYGGTHYAQFIVNTHSDSETQAILKDYTSKYSNYFPEAQVLFREIVYSDAQYPIDVRLVGDNIDSLRVATRMVESELRKNPQLLTVNTSMGTVNSNIEIDMDVNEASRINMSKNLLALNLALRYAGGIPAASVWEGNNEIPVVIKDINAGKQSIDELKNIKVTSFVPGITTEPLSQIASVKPSWSGGNICHRNGIRVANIYATVSRDAVIGKLTKDVYADMAKLKLPEGVKIEKGGQAQTESTYRPQLYLGMAISVVVIFFILLFHLKSISLTILLMASLLFALPGTSPGLLLFGNEFGATAMMGIISLMGIITRCGIIMVDYSKELQLKEEMTAEEAAKTAARRRFRPIFLTSAAASMGVVPMVIKNTPLWGPMGAVICIGSLVSMMFIITIIPVAYSFIMKNVKPFKASAILLLALLLPMPVDAQRTVTLDECLAMARKNNYKIRNADNEILMAKEQQKWARTKYYPTFSANMFHYEASDYLVRMDLLSSEWQEVAQDILDALGNPDDPTKIALLKRGSSASVGMVEPLYLGGRLSSVNKLTDLQIEARQLMREMADDEVVQQTEFLYYGIMMLHGKIRTLEASKRETESILKDARNLSDEGFVNQNDVLSVELTLDQLAALNLRLENTSKLMRRALAKTMGIPNDDIDVDTTVVAEVVAPETLWMDVQEAVNNRNESRLLDINVERAQQETKLARANLLPIVAIGGNLGATHIFSSTNVRAIGFITMAIPISAFWSEKHLLRRKKIAEKVAEDYRSDKRELIDLQVRDAYDNLVSAYKQIGIAEKSIARADENLRISREKYVNGVSTMTTLLDAQRQQLQAHDQHNDALNDYLRNKTNYLIVTGRHDKRL